MPEFVTRWSFLRRRSLVMGLAVGFLVMAPAARAGDLGAVPMLRTGSAASVPWQRYGDWTKSHWDFNSLADSSRSPAAPKLGDIMQMPPGPGDAEIGRKLAFSRDRGSSCVTCHVMGPQTPELPGNIGPDLSEYGSSGRSEQEVFNTIFDPRSVNPHSMMLPWGRNGFFSKEEIRHIVAFVMTLKAPSQFKDPLDDPQKRPVPVETRDWSDPFVNPAAAAIESGAELYRQASAGGKSCGGCHATPDVSFKSWAVTMPKWDPGMKAIVGVEEFITRHSAATMGVTWLMQSVENTNLSVYLHSLSNNQPITVDITSPGAKEAFQRGEVLSRAKIGQLNLSCENCHSSSMGGKHWMRGQYLGELPGQIAHFPTWRTSREEIWDIRKRFQWCNVQIRANELAPDAPQYGDLELYMAGISNGATMQVPGIRH